MQTVRFSALPIDQRFAWKGVSYIKTSEKFARAYGVDFALYPDTPCTIPNFTFELLELTEADCVEPDPIPPEGDYLKQKDAEER